MSKEEIKEISKEEMGTKLAKMMLAGFDLILLEFRRQFKVFLNTIPESLTNAIENVKEVI